MKPLFRKAGNPASHTPANPPQRRVALPLVFFAGTALAGCATTNPPPEISYDNAAPAVQTVEPPAPVTVVELPRPLPLPGQMKPVERSRRTPEPTDPMPTSATFAARDDRSTSRIEGSFMKVCRDSADSTTAGA